MARIKGVLQERRLAYEGAVELLKGQKQNAKMEVERAKVMEKRRRGAEAKAKVQARRAQLETMRRAMLRKQQLREAKSQDVGTKALEGLLS